MGSVYSEGDFYVGDEEDESESDYHSEMQVTSSRLDSENSVAPRSKAGSLFNEGKSDSSMQFGGTASNMYLINEPEH